MAGHTAAAERQLPCDDPERLGALLRSLEPRLTAVAFRLTRDETAAEDVVQSAFEKAVRHCRRFRGDSRVSTWLHRIVANEALMWLRAERRRSAACVEWNEDDARVADARPDPADELLVRQLGDLLRSGVARLRREERQVLLRCGVEGLSYEQFGAESGIHPAALKTRAFRARRRLGDILQGAWAGV